MIRELIFQSIARVIFRFAVIAQDDGIMAGTGEEVRRLAGELGIGLDSAVAPGERIFCGQVVVSGIAGPEQVARAEELMPGLISKPSGVATAAGRALELAEGKMQVVCGAWKKVPVAVRQQLREAALAGGVKLRISEEPFVYLDKNYVRMLGGIESAVRASLPLGRLVAVQLRGEENSLAGEAACAYRAGAGILMVDTGRPEDLAVVVKTAFSGGWRDRVKIAYAGNVSLTDIPALVSLGADIADVGRAILDAPMLDFRLEVLAKERNWL